MLNRFEVRNRVAKSFASARPWNGLVRFGALCLGLATMETRSAQFGPVFPSHRFPTDESFHATYRALRASSGWNFVEPLELNRLLNDSEIGVTKHELQLEYQPNRALSIGGILSFDQTSIAEKTRSLSASGLGDQRFWSEYRFYDEPGSSIGLGLVIKFPAYENKAATTGGLATFPGDAQTDYTALATAEFWPNETFRLRTNFGYTFRSEGFSDELPFLLSAGFVIPKFEIDLRIRGNLTLNSDSFTDDTLSSLRSAFGNSDYVFSPDPRLVIVNPSVEFWINPTWAVGIDFQYALMGVHAPSFSQYGLHLTYRWAKTHRRQTRTFKEVDIGTDQESGTFQGEEQDKVRELRPEDPSPIRPEPEEEAFD